MRVLHTADWHLGASLGPHSRLTEQAHFLRWLAPTITDEKIDLLLVTGDIFDTANPPKEADRLYYEFLATVTRDRALQVIILAGNHDSVWHLSAPAELLSALGVRVIGAAPLAEQSAIDLGSCVVVALPFLRERDYTKATPGETPAEAQARAQRDLISYHETAISTGRALAGTRPLIVTGHLTVLGATTSDSERSALVGTIDAVGADLFTGADYVALGHLHRPQAVAQRETVRYSGSPLPLSFSEAKDEKSVVIFDAENGVVLKPRFIPVPVIRGLYRLRGSTEEILTSVEKMTLNEALMAPWFEVHVIAPVATPELVASLHTAIEAKGGSILKLTIRPDEDTPLAWENEVTADLSEFSPADVFREKLVSDEAAALLAAFDQLVATES
jgi:DNA repair protein SbcD/Mre11